MSDNEKYLRRGGWSQNYSGWWHPPSCLAAWPEKDAMRMANRDEASGRRMTLDELRLHLREDGCRDVDEYLLLIS